jgi:hypothetical protein
MSFIGSKVRECLRLLRPHRRQGGGDEEGCAAELKSHLLAPG